MINHNGKIYENEYLLEVSNRGLNYGDALFESIRMSNGKLLFWEDHYFRLMASMRIMRMEIPMNFTLEFFEVEINKLINSFSANKNINARIKILVFRKTGGLYFPNTNNVDFIISINEIESPIYSLNLNKYTVDLYKDNYVSPSLLSTLKTNNKAINVLGSIYASENNINNCLLLNTNKSVVEALNSNLFLVKGKTIKTPPLSDGCLKGILRKQILDIFSSLPEYEVLETSISPFELQKADELFLTNVITGIQPITNYRKKVYTNTVAKELIGKLNLKVRLG